jgi:glucosamine-6-phosphate deaminase
LEKFFPEGWDLKKLDECCSNPPESITESQQWWHPDFKPVACKYLTEFNTMMGQEMALRIKQAKDEAKVDTARGLTLH